MSKVHIRVPYHKIEQVLDYQALDVNYEFVINIEDLMSFNTDKFIAYGFKEFSVHAPFHDISLGSLNPFVVDLSKQLLKDTFCICNEIGPSQVVTHHNYHPYIHAFKELEFAKRYTNNLMECFSDKSADYRLLFENVFETTPVVGVQILHHLADREDIGFCFDIGHFNLFAEVTLDEWISAWGRDIFEYHLHGNFGKYDEHFPVNSGNFNVSDLLSLLLPDVLTLENNSVYDAKKSFQQLQQHLENIS